ncbi:MAG TPA: HAD family hydrolase [Candidatus Saccharimonadales bacterium]|nr:HAD family hydrolase [Candidatus Saccharimonadales bacterium]
MPKYELVRHAGEVPYEDWAKAGVKVPIFDKDGTLTPVNQNVLLEDVMAALRRQQLGDLFDRLAVVSNNHDAAAVDAFAKKLEEELGIGVLAVSRAHDFNKKPNPAMGVMIAEQVGVEPRELGVIGDRRYTDVRFGIRLGAAKIALCQKMGEGDSRFVPTARRIEKIWVAADKVRGIAA